MMTYWGLPFPSPRSLSGWFITKGETPDRSGRGGRHSLPAWPGASAQRHQTKECAGEWGLKVISTHAKCVTLALITTLSIHQISSNVELIQLWASWLSGNAPAPHTNEFLIISIIFHLCCLLGSVRIAQPCLHSMMVGSYITVLLCPLTDLTMRENKGQCLMRHSIFMKWRSQATTHSCIVRTEVWKINFTHKLDALSTDLFGI